MADGADVHLKTPANFISQWQNLSQSGDMESTYTAM